MQSQSDFRRVTSLDACEPNREHRPYKLLDAKCHVTKSRLYGNRVFLSCCAISILGSLATLLESHLCRLVMSIEMAYETAMLDMIYRDGVRDSNAGYDLSRWRTRQQCWI